MMNSTGSRVSKKRKLSDGGPQDPRDITLTIHGPKGVVDTPIENIKVRRNRTWIECLEATNLQITHSVKAKYVIRQKSDDEGKYAQSFNSEVGTLADTLGSNKQFLEVVICRKFLPEEDKRATANPTSFGESRSRSRRDSPKEVPSTSLGNGTGTRCRSVPETSKRKELRTPNYNAKEKTGRSQSFSKNKSNRAETGGKRPYISNLDQLTALANELELPMEIVEHRVPTGGPSKTGDATSKWCVKIGERVFTQEIGSDSRAARGKVIKTALDEMRKVKHKLSFAKILQSDSRQGSSEGDINSLSLLIQIVQRQGLTAKFEIVEAEGSSHYPTFTGGVTVGYSFQGSGASKQAAKTAAAKAALVACALQKPTPATGGGDVEETLPEGWEMATAMMTGKCYGGVSRSLVTPNNVKSPAPSASNRENIDKLKVLSKLRGIAVTYTDFTPNQGYLCIASTDNPPNATHGYNNDLEAARNTAAGKMINELAHTHR